MAFYGSVWGSPSISYVSYVSCECVVFRMFLYASYVSYEGLWHLLRKPSQPFKL